MIIPQLGSHSHSTTNLTPLGVKLKIENLGCDSKIHRVKIKDTDGNQESIIVKIVKPPKIKNQSVDEGHRRKLRSYQVEAFFYESLSEKVNQSVGCRIATTLGVKCSEELNLQLALSDLNSEGFVNVVQDLNLEQTKVALKWLASFHATFWEFERPQGIWEQGSYWYLDTRQSEFKRMRNKSLQASAEKLDALTKGLDQNGNKSKKFRTLIHGDFKSENILFNQNFSECAAFDFQYVGEGYGARDVAYLLCSSTQKNIIQKYEDQLLKIYFEELISKLQRGRKNKVQFKFDDFLYQFDFCLADYVRFMDGWGCWGNSDWAINRSKNFLQKNL